MTNRKSNRKSHISTASTSLTLINDIHECHCVLLQLREVSDGDCKKTVTTVCLSVCLSFSLCVWSGPPTSVSVYGDEQCQLVSALDWSTRVQPHFLSWGMSLLRVFSRIKMYIKMMQSKARFPLTEFTARVLEPSWRPVNSGAFFDTRVDGPSWRMSKNAPESTRPVNSGRELG